MLLLMVLEQVTDCHHCLYFVSHLQHYDHTCSLSLIFVLLVLIQWLPSKCLCGVVSAFLQICLYDISCCTTILRQHLWWVCIDRHGSCMKPGWEDYVQWTWGSGRHEADRGYISPYFVTNPKTQKVMNTRPLGCFEYPAIHMHRDSNYSGIPSIRFCGR